MSDSMTGGGVSPAVAISVGAVIKRTFSVFFANLLPFGILALVLHLPGLLYNYMTLDETLSGAGPSFSPGQIVVIVLSLVLSYLLMGAVVYGTVSHMRGRQAGLGEIVSRGLTAVLPIIVIAIAASVIMAVGFALFIIPGIFLGVIFAVVLPAYVVERPGIVGSFKRSMELTKGNRWRVLGILIILFVILAVIGMVIGAVTGFVAVMGTGLGLVAIVNYVISALSSAVVAVAVAVLYHDLRIAKEGVSTEQIAAVFD
ncbi:hypothetical protein HBA54_24795 [Pelagibius litoralis]|uniref:DUF7847 domain-containing protein n=1 Tax=Pelagibius litoralis TaxID=374515 RepID=A0A967KE89_9PROT|nr:hypothetical protein [Pelagibius litoralis]NIA71819.1 hypothetical protein [Pelagibius litoralis]